jgi:hypothetical protein
MSPATVVKVVASCILTVVVAPAMIDNSIKATISPYLIAVALRLSRRFRKILRMAFDLHEEDTMITASDYY